jgi:glycosyltransferase involved in cell wall biosynthesis
MPTAVEPAATVDRAGACDATDRAPLFTIFTPTYNRAHTLHRCFESLSAQTLHDFEWIVVDDGSTDATGQLVEGWIKSAKFPIRYLRQDHGGKHIAHNLAVSEARGYFFACLDSDDGLTQNCLQRLAYHWETIPETEREFFSGVDGLCSDVGGKIVGMRFPLDVLDTDLREMKYVYRLYGEKWGMGRTDIMRRYLFPEIARGEYLPEGIVWLDIAKKFRSRAVNEVVRIYYVDDTQAGVTADKKRDLGAHATGRWHFYIWLLNNDLEYFFSYPLPFLKAAVMLPIVARMSRHAIWRTLTSLRSAESKMLLLACLPLSLLICTVDRINRLVG